MLSSTLLPNCNVNFWRSIQSVCNTLCSFDRLERVRKKTSAERGAQLWIPIQTLHDHLLVSCVHLWIHLIVFICNLVIVELIQLAWTKINIVSVEFYMKSTCLFLSNAQRMPMEDKILY